MPLKSILLFCFIVFLLKCGGSNTSNFKILTGVKNDKVIWGDTLKLRLNKIIEGAKVDYFLNKKPIKSNHVLTNESLGTHSLKAVVSNDEIIFEKTINLTLVAPNPPKLYTYEIINSYPHDISAYTQGLEFDGEILYESTGLNGKSSIRIVDYKTGVISLNRPLDTNFFGEGLTILKNKVIQLTWKSMKGLVYDKKTLEMQKSFPFSASKEGWGLCNDGSLLYKSDGTHRIWTLDAKTYEEKGNIQVMTHKTSIKNLNELEWVDGKIYANTYQFKKDVVVIIDPVSGSVDGVVDFSGLKEKVKQHKQLNVFNGIAYHSSRKTFFVTGKNWDTLFEVNIIPKE